MSVVGIDDVLRAGVSEAAVNHHQFSMVPQVNPRHPAPEEADGHCLPQQNPLFLHLVAQRPEHAAGAHRIHKDPANHPATNRAGQRIGHTTPGLVVGKNVEKHMDVALGGVNVGDDSGDDFVGFREQLEIVAAEDWKIAEAFGERKRGTHFLAEFRAGDMRTRRRITSGGFDRLEQFPVALYAAAR